MKGNGLTEKEYKIIDEEYEKHKFDNIPNQKQIDDYVIGAWAINPSISKRQIIEMAVLHFGFCYDSTEIAVEKTVDRIK